jgi:hypothetical protein
METQSDPNTEESNTDPGAPGAEGGEESPSADVHPGRPADDDAALGDTDQHSNA